MTKSALQRLIILASTILVVLVAIALMQRQPSNKSTIIETAGDATVESVAALAVIHEDAGIGGKTVGADSFTIEVPDSWVVTPRPAQWGDDRVRGLYTYGWLYSDVMDDAYTNFDIVSIMVDDIMVIDTAYDEVVASYAYSTEELSHLSASLKEQFNNPDDAPSIDEITYEEASVMVGGKPARRILLGSEKPLGIEGGPTTVEWYIVDDGDRAIIISIHLGTSKKTDAFLTLGRAVVATFAFTQE